VIHLHRLNGQRLVVNADLIELIEDHHVNTVIHLATNNRMVVKESLQEVVDAVIQYKQKVYVNVSYLPDLLKWKGPAAKEAMSQTSKEIGRK